MYAEDKWTIFLSASILCFIIGVLMVTTGFAGDLAGMWIMAGIFVAIIFAFLNVPPAIPFMIFFMLACLQSCFKEPLFMGNPLNNYYYFTSDGGSGVNSGYVTSQHWLLVPTEATWLWLKENMDDSRIQEWLVKNDMTEKELMEIGKKNTMEWHDSIYHFDNEEVIERVKKKNAERVSDY